MGDRYTDLRPLLRMSDRKSGFVSSTITSIVFSANPHFDSAQCSSVNRIPYESLRYRVLICIQASRKICDFLLIFVDLFLNMKLGA